MCLSASRNSRHEFAEVPLIPCNHNRVHLIPDGSDDCIWRSRQEQLAYQIDIVSTLYEEVRHRLRDVLVNQKTHASAGLSSFPPVSLEGYSSPHVGRRQSRVLLAYRRDGEASLSEVPNRRRRNASARNHRLVTDYVAFLTHFTDLRSPPLSQSLNFALSVVCDALPRYAERGLPSGPAGCQHASIWVVKEHPASRNIQRQTRPRRLVALQELFCSLSQFLQRDTMGLS
jgi:hypothetical protein